MRFSEPQSEPTPDTKLRIMLSNVVQNTIAGKDRKIGPTIQIGSVSTLGKLNFVIIDQGLYRKAMIPPPPQNFILGYLHVISRSHEEQP